MADEARVKLSLDNSEFVAALNQATATGSEFLDALKLFGPEASKAETATESLADALSRLKSDEIALQPAVAQTSAAVALGVEKVEKAAEAAGKLSGSHANLGRSALEASRALQDFAQGGLGGILNNIEGFTAAVGGGPGLAGLMAGLGVAALLAKPLVTKLWDALAAGAANELPTSRDRVKELTDALDENRKRLKELEDQHKLTAGQLQEYNTRLAASAKLEREAADAKKTRAALEAARDRPTDEAKDIAADVQAVVGNDPDSLIKAAQAALLKSGSSGGELGRRQEALRRSIRTYQEQVARDPFNLVGTQGGMERDIEARRKAVEAERGRIGQQAEDLVGRALRGDSRALNDLVGTLPAGRTRDDLSSLTPDARRRQDEEERATEAFGERAHDAGVSRRKRAGEDRAFREAAAKEAKQAQAEEEAGIEAASKAEEQAREKAAHEAEQARKRAERDAEPSNRLRAMQSAQQDALTAEALRQSGNGDLPTVRTPQQLDRVVRDAVDRLPDTDGNLAAAIQQAAWAGYRKSQQAIARGMQRQQVDSESFYGGF
ncbi:hypothetical protein [Aquisphaera insulae]|uniref:hypothetical protein n=1 Tax=Aquisphaera insulae TaxID=2712864 RepID=UPI0013ED3DBA|nr:hypothetical protein [Aquisphaera insulae]